MSVGNNNRDHATSSKRAQLFSKLSKSGIDSYVAKKSALFCNRLFDHDNCALYNKKWLLFARILNSVFYPIKILKIFCSISYYFWSMAIFCLLLLNGRETDFIFLMLQVVYELRSTYGPIYNITRLKILSV